MSENGRRLAYSRRSDRPGRLECTTCLREVDQRVCGKSSAGVRLAGQVSLLGRRPAFMEAPHFFRAASFKPHHLIVRSQFSPE